MPPDHWNDFLSVVCAESDQLIILDGVDLSVQKLTRIMSPSDSEPSIRSPAQVPSPLSSVPSHDLPILTVLSGSESISVKWL